MLQTTPSINWPTRQCVLRAIAYKIYHVQDNAFKIRNKPVEPYFNLTNTRTVTGLLPTSLALVLVKFITVLSVHRRNI